MANIEKGKGFIDIERSLGEWLYAETVNMDTLITIAQTGDAAQFQLTWVEALALHKWLGDRLGV